jgi:hypothetical protein
MARINRSSGSSSRRIDTPIGYNANDAPCSTRATINRGNDEVTAPSTEPAITTASTASSTRFLTCRSARRPSRGVLDAAASRLAVTTQLTSTAETSS